MKKELTAKESSSIFVIGFFVCQVLVLIANLIGIIIGTSLGYDTTSIELFFNTAVGYLICAIALDLGMVLCFIYSKKRYEFKPIAKPTFKKVVIYILIGIASFLALYPIITCVDSLISSWGITYQEPPYAYTTVNYLISILSLVIFPAVCEELLFRGIIYSGFSRYGKWIAITLSSVMFAIFHMSIYQTIYPILFGLLLGGIMHRENNIIYCIITHAINNFLSLTLSYLDISLIFNHWTYIMLAVVACAIWLTLVILYINKKPSTKTKPTKTDIGFIITSLSIMIILWIMTLFVN